MLFRSVARPDNARHVLLLAPTAQDLPERPVDAAHGTASAPEIAKGHRPGHSKDKDSKDKDKGAKP